MSEKKPTLIGGDSKESLKGGYSFDLSELLRQGWHLTQTHKWVLVQMALITFACAAFIAVLALGVLGVEDVKNIPAKVHVGLDLLLTVLTAPLVAAMMLTGVNHAVGGKGHVKHLFKLLPYSAPLATTALLIALATLLVSLISMLFVAYIAVATTFSMLLVVDKKLAPWQAIWLSIRMVNVYWLAFLKLFAVFFVLLLICAITLGVALIWVIPFYYHVKGILYRDLFGAHVADNNLEGENQHEAVFFA